LIIGNRVFFNGFPPKNKFEKGVEDIFTSVTYLLSKLIPITGLTFGNDGRLGIEGRFPRIFVRAPDGLRDAANFLMLSAVGRLGGFTFDKESVALLSLLKVPSDGLRDAANPLMLSAVGRFGNDSVVFDKDPIRELRFLIDGRL
jgi:hypothetical protein